jgi:hypothetical protein
MSPVFYTFFYILYSLALCPDFVITSQLPKISDRWDWLGPFSVAFGERGVDAISFETSNHTPANNKPPSDTEYEYINKLPRPDGKLYATELVPGGRVGWTKVSNPTN